MPPRFQVTYKGRDIQRIDLPQSGIRYSLLFEMILAAKWRGLTDEQFDSLAPDAQARTLAAYRTAMRIDAVLTHEAIRERSKPTTGRRRR